MRRGIVTLLGKSTQVVLGLLIGVLSLQACSLLQREGEGSAVTPRGEPEVSQPPPPVLDLPDPPTSGDGSMQGAAGANTSDDGTSEPAACGSLDMLGACGATSVLADLRKVNMLVVLDKSGSMTDVPSGFETDKWSAVKTAVGEALSGVAADVSLGLLMYPYSRVTEIPLVCRSGCCEVPEGGDAVNVDIDAGQRSLPKILSALEATSPGGGTPTAAALARADEYFTTGLGAELKGNNYVLLATDGGPNCNAESVCSADKCTTNLDGQCDSGNCCQGLGEGCLDDAGVREQITALRGHGVRTFVVGIPGTEQYGSYLDEFAIAGGLPSSDDFPSYYAVSAAGGARGLVEVFTEITTQLVRSCRIPLTSDPPRLTEVNLAVDCEVVAPESDDGSGWELDADANPMEVVIKGPLCDRVQGEGVERIDVVYGCPTIR
jgi:hypothetical protein